MLVVDMLDKILDSLSEALMHKMQSSRVMRVRCLSLAASLPRGTQAQVSRVHENFVWGPRAGIISS